MEINKISGNYKNIDVVSKGYTVSKPVDMSRYKKPSTKIETRSGEFNQGNKKEEKVPNSPTEKNTSFLNSEEGYDEKLNKLLNEVNEKFKIASREFSYDIHEKTNRYMVTVKDTETGDVIREIPSEESLDFFAKMLEMAGLLVDEKR